MVEPRYLARFFTTPDYWRQIEKEAQGVAALSAIFYI